MFWCAVAPERPRRGAGEDTAGGEGAFRRRHHRGAHASTRVTVTAMAMGEAAGVASAMAVKAGTTVQEIAGAKVREALAAKGGGPFTEA